MFDELITFLIKFTFLFNMFVYESDMHYYLFTTIVVELSITLLKKSWSINSILGGISSSNSELYLDR